MTDNKLVEVERAVRDAVEYDQEDAVCAQVLPIISRLLDAAHADALSAAAAIIVMDGCDGPNCDLPVHVRAKQRSEQILALTPEGTHLKRKLEVARAVAEALERVCNPFTITENRITANRQVADLEAKLAALEAK